MSIVKLLTIAETFILEVLVLDGFFSIVGRAKEIIITSGEYPSNEVKSKKREKFSFNLLNHHSKFGRLRFITKYVQKTILHV